MTDIFDIHTHVLPGIDDGAESIEEAMQMLKLAGEQGITEVIATPHYSHYSRFFQRLSPDEIRKLCTKLQRKMEESYGVQIKIWPGQEIFYTDNVVHKLEKKELLTMADSSYVLLEFYPSVAYSDLFRVVREMVVERYRPILAHVERYDVLQDSYKIEELTEQGAYIQMNFRLLGGKWSEKRTRWCRKLLKEEKVHFLGTDMHNTKRRKPEVKAAVDWMRRHLDEDYIDRVLRGNAEKILKDEKV